MRQREDLFPLAGNKSSVHRDPARHNTFDAGHADVIHRTLACAAAYFAVRGLSVVAAKLFAMDLQAAPGDAVGRAVGSGGPDTPPCAPGRRRAPPVLQG